MSIPNQPNPFSDSNNPYATPVSDTYATASGVKRANRTPFPTFVIVVSIIAIVLACIRGLIVLMGIGVYASGSMPANDPLRPYLLPEILTGAMITVFGVLGFGLILARQRVGILLAGLSLLGVIGSCIVGFVEMPVMLQARGVPESEMMSAYIVGGVVFMIRMAILTLNAIAIIRFSKWLSQNEASMRP